MSLKLSRKKRKALCCRRSAPALSSSRVPNSHLLYYCGDPGALDRASGSQHSRGDVTLAWPVCRCHPHPLPVCKEEILGSPRDAAAVWLPTAWLGLLLPLAIRCLSGLFLVFILKAGV